MRQAPKAAAFVVFGLMAGLLTTGFMPQGQADPVAGGPIAKDPVSFRDVVKKVLPAVVSIQVTSRTSQKAVRNVPEEVDPSDDMPFQDKEMRRYLDELRRRRGMREIPDALISQFGSGVVIDPSGIVLTNHHVVAGAAQVEVTFKDGRRLHSKQIAADPKTDVAIIKLTSSSPFAYAELGDSDQMEIGDRVLAVGAPYGLAGSVTHGIVSAKGRTLTQDPGQYEDFIQTDAAINPGNSGGPLINLEGKVVGINTAIKSQSGGFQGIGMAVPSNMAKIVMTQLAKDGVVRRGYLGVQIQDLTADLAEKLGVNVARGVLLGPVTETGPAGKAGLKEGDVITAINSRPVEDGRGLQQAVALSTIGKPAEVSIIRNGKSQMVRVVIEQQPGDFLAVNNKPEPTRRPNGRQPSERDLVPEKTLTLDKIGVEVADCTPELAERFGSKEMKGAVITNVEQGSVAQLGGLRRGMVIVQAERKTVESAEGLKNTLSKASVAEGVLLQIKTPQGGSRYIVLRAEG